MSAYTDAALRDAIEWVKALYDSEMSTEEVFAAFGVTAAEAAELAMPIAGTSELADNALHLAMATSLVLTGLQWGLALAEPAVTHREVLP